MTWSWGRRTRRRVSKTSPPVGWGEDSQRNTIDDQWQLGGDRRQRVDGVGRGGAGGLNVGDGESPVLEVDAVDVSYGGVVALAGCSLTVRQRCTALIGPNGSGKSTLLDVISGFRRADRGSVLLAGRPLRGAPHARVAHGLVRTFQLPQEFGGLTVLENVMLPMEVHRRWPRKVENTGVVDQGSDVIESRAWDMVDWVGLGSKANDPARTLSGGQKKLLELARAVACRPSVLLLDEPFAGVAKPLAAALSSRIRELNASGLAVLLVEHDMARVAELAQEVVVLAGGVVIGVGTYEEVRAMRTVQDAYLGRVAAVGNGS